MSIEIKNLKYKYEDYEALKGIDLSIQKGKWITIVGHNGSGKSTLVKILSTLYTLQNGEIIVDGVSLSENTKLDIRKKFGVVFQNPDNQFVGTTVFDDVCFGLQNLSIPKDEIFYRVNKYLELVGMSNMKTREPHTLSGGQKQRVAIASVLSLEPEYIILDEATSMLDPQGRSEVLELVKYINETTNTTIISITHDLDEAILGDEIVALYDGKVVKTGTSDQICDNIGLFEKIGLSVPFVLKLASDLKNLGLDVPLTYDLDRLVKSLCR